jgi:hypothetical protein
VQTEQNAPFYMASRKRNWQAPRQFNNVLSQETAQIVILPHQKPINNAKVKIQNELLLGHVVKLCRRLRKGFLKSNNY